MDGTRGRTSAQTPPTQDVLADTEQIAALGSEVGATAGREALLAWDAVHAIVQGALSRLTERVLAECPGAQWKAGRVSARAFPLFSYRVFYHLDGDDYDPVVVGLTFDERGPDVRITGDISGDETGHIYFDEDCDRIVAAVPDAVVEEASRIAGLLAAQPRIVIQAIRNRLFRSGGRDDGHS